MPIYTIGTPDGRKLRIEAPDETTALRGAEEWGASQQQIAPPQPMPQVDTGGQAAPPAGLRPGSRAYAQWAAQQARAGASLPQVGQHQTTESSVLDPFVQGATFGWGDELRGAVQGGLAAAQGGDFGSVYGQVVDESRNALERERRVNPVGSFAAEVAGAIPTGIAAGGGAVAGGGSLLSRALAGGAVGGVQGAVYGAGASEGGLEDRVKGAATTGGAGATIGAAIPFAGSAIASRLRNVAQSRATNAAIQGAPDAGDLKSAASAMFKQVDNSGVSIDPTFFGGKVLQMAQKAGQKLIDQELDAPAYRMYQIMAQRVRSAFEAGKGLTLGEIHNLRQIARDVAMKAGKGRTAQFADDVIDEIDNVMANLKPANLLGGHGADKGRVLLEGISTWSRARKVGLIEEAIYKAQNQASGLENGLRIQFRQLLQNPKTRRLFTKIERDAIEQVVRGTPRANLAKLVGKFGFGSGNASNMLGGTIGFGAGSLSPLGPVGGMIAAGGATLARRGSEALTNRAANRAAQVMATPNIPVLPPVSGAVQSLPEAALRSLVAPSAEQTGRPLRVVVEGASSYR